MVKEKIKRIAAVLAAVICMPNMSFAAETTKTLVYEATIAHGTSVYGISGKQERTFGDYAQFDFANGTLSVSSTTENVENGTTSYALPPNGDKFKFAYIVDPSTGKLSLAVNGEICAEGTVESLKGKTAINETWKQKWTTENPTVLEDAGIVTPAEQSVKADACDLSLIRIRLTRPIQYADIAKLGMYDEAGNKVEIVDYTKNNDLITLKPAKLFTANARYTIKGEDVPDIYGGSADIEFAFRPTAGGTAAAGKDVTPSEDTEKAWGFERRIDWHEESNLTQDNEWTASQMFIGEDFYSRIYALELSDKHVNEGEYSLKWDNHPYYSTVATECVEKDWTGANTFNMWMYSEKATNETVTVLIYSDNPKTPWKDGYTYPIKIDWTGEKEISIPLSDFNTLESPTGFNNVSGIYFTTKIYNGEPNPNTVLYLDDISVTYSSEYPITPNPSPRTVALNNHRGMPFDDSRLNHGETEVTTDPGTPYTYENYYKTERALYGYNPQYRPGVASFDKDGKIYIKADGTHIQYLGDDGKWKVVDLEPYMKGEGRIWDSNTDEPVVRFDNDGWAYVLVTTENGSYLLWSKDGMQTWEKYKFTEANTFCTRFEHIEGNNTAAMNKPPLILGHDQTSSGVQGPGKLIIPTKTADGGLEFKYVQYADSCINTAAHTGDGNFVISSKDTAYVVYGIYKYEEYKTQQGENLKEIVPDNHGITKSYVNSTGTTKNYSDGVPTFIRSVNLTDGTLSDPKFLGFGGTADDDHNWPGISMDSDGYIHVIMNGHHDPIAYVKSKKANSIDSWGDIDYIGISSKQGESEQHSYGALLIDADDTIHIMTRNASRGYRFDTSITRKEKKTFSILEKWETNYILKRKDPFYEVARQRMSYNPTTKELYVHYYSQSNYFEVYGDEYQSVLFTWPNEERTMYMTTSGKIPSGTLKISGSTKQFFSLSDAGAGREGVLVKSTDGGKTFKMVKTSDVN